MAYLLKTEDEYEIQGCYFSEWEMVTTETTRRLAQEQRRAYRENEPGVPFRIKKKRVRIEEANHELNQCCVAG